MKKQLLKDIGDLEAAQVITPETASNIRDWYRNQETSAPGKLGIILGILGALLAGSGILLIIAHNWDDLNKFSKTILAFIPLILAQLLCIYSLVKQNDSKLWKECSAVLLFFAIPASISLISQVYQIDGTLSGFLLTWILLTLPLVYIMRSSVVLLLSIVTATWYAALAGYYNRPDEIPYLYLLMMIFITPYYLQLLRTKTSGSNWLLLTNLGLSLSIAIVLGCFLNVDDDWYPFINATYLILFCIYYFIGQLKHFSEQPVTVKPFYIIGLVGILAILFLWSFDWLWKGYSTGDKDNLFVTPLPYLIITGMGLIIWLVKKNRFQVSEAGNYLIGLSFAPFLLSLVFIQRLPAPGIIMINGWVLIIAIVFIRKGSRENHFGILNFGLFVLAALALCRFFDQSIPFVWRGVFFLGTGIAFFISNYLLLNKRKGLTTIINR